MINVTRWDMRLTDTAVLKALHQVTDATTQADIAASLGCHPGSLNRIIRRLKQAGWIEPLGTGRTYAGYKILYDKLPESLRMEFEA